MIMAEAKVVETSKGLSGMLRTFKSTMASMGLKLNDKVVFVGCSGTCVPFIELFAYTIREPRVNMVLVPDGRLDEARSIWQVQGIGMQIGGAMDPQGADFVVLLGGLCMPGSCMTAEGAEALVESILKPGGKVVGVCFMDMFCKAGWQNKVRFDVMMDVNVDPVNVLKFQ